jgi:GT2 family glycosyltransferase
LRLNRCLEELKKQVNKIYVFDNSDSSTEMKCENVVYMSEKENRGIAYALNRIMENAHADGYQWVVTMDQDSVIPDGMIKGFIESIQSHSDLGIVCPRVIDKRRIYSISESDEKETYVDFCITSASCTSVEVWERCGKFDEWLFIDLVDNDFCKRLTLSGYKILKLNKWVLDQEFGKIIPKSRKKQEFWFKVSKIMHNENFAKFSYKKFVSPLRVYYTNRNILYVNKKMRQYGAVGYENYNCKGYLGFIICFMLPSILRAQNKVKVIKATIKGIKDGMVSRPIEWSI